MDFFVTISGTANHTAGSHRPYPELRPRIDVQPSAHVVSFPCVITLPLSVTGERKFVVTVPWSRLAAHEIPASAALLFSLVATTRPSSGRDPRQYTVPLAEASVYVSAILESADQTLVLDKIVLRDPIDPEITKAVLTGVRIRLQYRERITFGRRQPGRQFLSDSADAWTERITHYNIEFQKFVQTTHSPFRSLGNLKWMHMPPYPSRTETGARIPAWAMLTMIPSTPSSQYYANLLAIADRAFARDEMLKIAERMRIDDVRVTIREIDMFWTAFGMAMSLTSNHTVYASDHSNVTDASEAKHNATSTVDLNVERIFDVMIGGGDCEDKGINIYRHFAVLRSRANTAWSRRTKLLELGCILLLEWVPALVETSSTSAQAIEKASGDETAITNAAILHSHAILIPRSSMTMMQRRDDRAPRNAAEVLPPVWSQKTIPLVLEGTGLTFPLPGGVRDAAGQAVREKIMAAKFKLEERVTGLRKLYWWMYPSEHHTHRDYVEGKYRISTFYNRPTHLLSYDPTTGLPTDYLITDRRSAHGAYGLPAAHLFLASDRIRLVKIEDGMAWSPGHTLETFHAMSEDIAELQPPVPPLVAPSTQQVRIPKNLKRLAANTSQFVDAAVAVDYWIPSGEFILDADFETMADELVKLRVRVTVDAYAITKDRQWYVMHVHAPSN